MELYDEKNADKAEKDAYKQELIIFWILNGVLYLCEFYLLLVMMCFQITLFNLNLSIMQIILYSVAILMINFFILESWDVIDYWKIMFVGGILPAFLELFTMIVNCTEKRRITKIE